MKHNSISKSLSLAVLAVFFAIASLFVCPFKNNMLGSTCNASSVFVDNEIDNNENSALTDELDQSINYTVFMKDVLFATIYDNVVYFIDNDHPTYILKSYNLERGTFSSNILQFEDISEIYDVCYLNGKFFILSDSGIYAVSLGSTSSLTKLQVGDNLTFSDYCAISSHMYQDGQENKFMLLLTPSNNGTANQDNADADENVTPKILIFDENLGFLCNIEITLTQTEITKIMAIDCYDNTSSIGFLVIYNKNVYYQTVNISSLTNTTQNLNFNVENVFNQPLGENISSINLMKISGTTFLVVSYQDTEHNCFSNYYKIQISASSTERTSTYLTYESSDDHHVHTSESYALTSENIFICSSGQAIRICKLSYISNSLSFDISEITNPTIDITYYTEPNFIYATTIDTTYIKTAPWTVDEEATAVEVDLDVIIIGQGYILVETDLDGSISVEKQPINDYLYCLFTAEGVNHIGFIEASNLVLKSDLVESGQLVITSYNAVLKAKPNSALYSAPTKVLNDEITNQLTSTILLNIPENSRLNFVDALYNYTSNSSIFLKVEVNGITGYIEYDSLISPSDAANFVLTNAYIKHNGTIVYLEEDVNSPIIHILESGKRVKINGTRNTKTGFTYITFNDEYGNEFSGYILNSNTGTDGWSTLQIIGFILIAINIGLLILILYVKNTRIGYNGQKYEKSKQKN